MVLSLHSKKITIFRKNFYGILFGPNYYSEFIWEYNNDEIFGLNLVQSNNNLLVKIKMLNLLSCFEIKISWILSLKITFISISLITKKKY